MNNDPGAEQARREVVKLGIYLLIALVITVLSRQWWRSEIREVAREVYIEMQEDQ